jgi:hypothetical protein
VELGKDASGTYAVLSEVCGGEVMVKTSAFKEGGANVEDDEKSGLSKSHRTDKNVEKLR